MSGVNLQRDGNVLLVEIDNPPLNVITTPMRAELAGLLRNVGAGGEVRAMVFLGAGDAFCAGADLQRYADGTLPFSTIDDVLAYDAEIFGAIETSPIPSVAAIGGYCIGGGLELALACDIRICSAEARFRSPGARLGMLANTTRLTRLFGPAVAADLVITSRTVGGEEAARMGLVTRCVPLPELRAEALEIARTIASRAPLSVAAAKKAIAHAATAIDAEALRYENELYLALRDTEDHAEAVRAFFTKSEPQFRGK